MRCAILCYILLTRCLLGAYPVPRPSDRNLQERRYAKAHPAHRRGGQAVGCRHIRLGYVPPWLRTTRQTVGSTLVRHPISKRGGRSRRHTIGRHGILKAEEARRRGRILLGKVTDGVDPAADAKETLKAPTVRQLAGRYTKDVAKLHAKPSYLAQIERMLSTKILPKLGPLKVAGVTRADVAALHTEMQDTPYEANRCLALVAVMFKHAEIWHWRPEGTNPARLLQRYRERRRERLLSDAEIGRIFAAFAEAGRTQTEPRSALLAIRLLFATACRAGEILGLQWDFLNQQPGEIVWPDSKTGGMRKPATVEVRRLLETATRVVGNPYVCVGVKNRAAALSMSTLGHVWRRILAKAKVPHCGLHAIRHRAATDIANSGVPIHVGMALTGHRAFETFRRYLHTERKQTLDAAEHVSRRRDAIVAKAASQRSESVVRMRKRT